MPRKSALPGFLLHEPPGNGSGTGAGGEALPGVAGDGQEAVDAEEADGADRGGASVFREEGEAAARARQGAEGVGGEGAGHHLGRDKGAPRPGLHDPRDPSGAGEARPDI